MNTVIIERLSTRPGKKARQKLNEIKVSLRNRQCKFPIVRKYKEKGEKEFFFLYNKKNTKKIGEKTPNILYSKNFS